MFCPKCNMLIDDNAEFCPGCGARIEKGSTQATAFQPPVQPQPVRQPIPQPVQQSAAQPMNRPFAAQPAPQRPVDLQSAAPVYSQQPFAPQGVTPAYAQQPAPAKKKSKAGLIIGIVGGAIALLLILGLIIGSIFLFSNSRKIIGDWKTTIDLTDFMLDDMGEMGKYMGDDFTFTLDYTFSFKDDGTYAATSDEASYNQSLDSLKSELKLAMAKYVRDEYSDYEYYSDEEIFEELEESLHQSIDDYLDEELEELEYSHIKDETCFEGQYKVDDEKLHLSNGLDVSVSDENYFVYSISGKTMTISEVHGEENVLDEEDIFTLPLTFKKVK